MSDLYQKVKNRYRSDGLRVLLRDSLRYAKNGFRKPRYQADERVDTTDRWKLIGSHISEDDSNLLDIGCADGVLTAKFAEDGLFCVGIERDETNLRLAHKTFGRLNGVAYMKHETDPTNIDSLPTFDVILLLTVYEWWCRDFGITNAERMLEALYGRSNKLFFEGHGDQIGHGGPRRTEQGVPEYYAAYFNNVLDGPDIEFVGMTEYKGGDRKDPVFVIS